MPYLGLFCVLAVVCMIVVLRTRSTEKITVTGALCSCTSVLAWLYGFDTRTRMCGCVNVCVECAVTVLAIAVASELVTSLLRLCCPITLMTFHLAVTQPTFASSK